MRDFKIEEVTYMNDTVKFQVFAGVSERETWVLMDGECESYEIAVQRVQQMKGKIVKDRKVVYCD